MWRGDEILEAVRTALDRRDQELRAEQAVHGLDALDEIGLQAVLANGLADAAAAGNPAWGVLREQPYPQEWRSRRRVSIGGDGEPTGQVEPLPAHRDRLRCDLVLTPEPGRLLGDPVLTEKTRQSVRRQAEGTLFEQTAIGDGESAALAAGVARVAPEDAYWLEVKVVAQFACGTGVPGPNRTYASELLRGVAGDVAKLDSDPKISRGGVLLLLFTIDQATADHDVVVVMHRCLDRGLPVSSPLSARISIPDRIGNCTLSAWLVEVRK